jgi:hypothetical protein
MSAKPTRRHILGGLLAALLGSWRPRLPAAPKATRDPPGGLPAFSYTGGRVLWEARYTYDDKLTYCRDYAGLTTTVYDGRGGQLPL